MQTVYLSRICFPTHRNGEVRNAQRLPATAAANPGKKGERQDQGEPAQRAEGLGLAGHRMLLET